MGNCAGCTGPQRTYRVQRLQQNSPIKNRLSQGTKHYPQSNSMKELPFLEKDKLPQRNSFNENDVFGNIIGLSHSKSRPGINHNQPYNNFQSPAGTYPVNQYGTNNILYQANTQQNGYNDYTKDILSQVVRTHIKLYPDNPQNHKQISPKLNKSYLYQKQEDLRNSNLDTMKKSNSPDSYSKQLLKSVQTQSKRYLRQNSGQKQSPQRNNAHNFQKIELKTVQMNQMSTFQTSHIEPFLPKFDQISEIRTQKNSKVNYQNQNSLPLKKNSKYNRGLTVIEEILQQDHKTPQDIRIERKNNGQDVIFDTFEGFPEQIEPLEIPNFSEYLWVLKQIKQRN